MDAQKIAWGGYDTQDYLRQGGSKAINEIQFDKWYRGAGADGIDRRDVVPYINGVEDQTLRFNKRGVNGPAAVGLEEIWQIASSHHATHMKWIYTPSGNDITWAQVKDFVEVRKKGAVPSSACPSSFPSCVTR